MVNAAGRSVFLLKGKRQLALQKDFGNRRRKPERLIMNTKLLQEHMASSLFGLAKACEKNHKTENTDRLLLQVLSEDRLDVENLLIRIEEIQEEKRRICSEDSMELVPALNLNQLYSMQNRDAAQQNLLWSGLHTIAVNLVDEDVHEPDNQNRIEFIYRALLDMAECSDMTSTLKEMDIVVRLSN